jgi:hypothetical protein
VPAFSPILPFKLTTLKSALTSPIQCISISEVHSPKASFPIEVKEFGNVIEASELQSQKVISLMVSNPSGSVIEVNASHPAKAKLPIVVNELGSVIEGNEKHSQKTLSPIEVKELGSVIETSESHQTKAESPMVSNPSGSFIEVNKIHPLKAYSWRFVKESVLFSSNVISPYTKSSTVTVLLVHLPSLFKPVTNAFPLPQSNNSNVVFPAAKEMFVIEKQLSKA